MTPREAADVIADQVFRWTHQVLSPEDRDEMAAVIEEVGLPPSYAALERLLPSPSCAFCGNTSRWHNSLLCQRSYVARLRSLRAESR